MRASAGLLALVALAACENEPTFEERYDSAQEQIEDKAEELDDELDTSRSSDTTAAEKETSVSH